MARRKQQHDFLFGGGAVARAAARVRLDQQPGSAPASWDAVRSAEGQTARALIRGAWCDVELCDVSAELEPLKERYDPPRFHEVLGVWVWHAGFKTHFWLANLRFLRLLPAEAAKAAA